MSSPVVASALERLSGPRGTALAVQLLSEQPLLKGDIKIAEALREQGTICKFEQGDRLFSENDWSNEIYFLLIGSVEVFITGFRIASRTAGQYVGEMALIDPSKARSATVICTEPTVALAVPESIFSDVADKNPSIWRSLSRQIAERLRERSKYIRPTNSVPIMFLACASESLGVAHAIKDELSSSSLIVKLWTDGIFKPSNHTIEDLETILNSVDFALAVLSADDKVISREKDTVAPRDNTIFELGLFAGAIGRNRTFFIRDKEREIKIPSDLAGVTSLSYSALDGHHWDIAKACHVIRSRISELGQR